jgi:hypothetical protein
VNRIKMEDFTKNLRLEEREAEAKRLQAIARLETVTVKLKRHVMATDAKGAEKLHSPILSRDIVRGETGEIALFFIYALRQRCGISTTLLCWKWI